MNGESVIRDLIIVLMGMNFGLYCKMAQVHKALKGKKNGR